MSQKDVVDYEESLPEAKDKYHMVVNGNLYLLFDPKVSALNNGHKQIIEQKVVPFLVRAITRLGPGQYYLYVYGAASATNHTGNNDDLAAARAYNSAIYAIKKFEEKQETELDLLNAKLDPSVINVSDQLSSTEAKLLHLKPYQIEKAQATHRAAMFKFKAQLNHPAGSNIFRIREVYKFKFEKIQKPLPQFLAEIEKEVEDFEEKNPIGKFVFDYAFKKALKKAIQLVTDGKDIIPPQYQPLVQLFKYMIPKDIESCFELADYRDQTATYRFTGEGHEGIISFSSVIGMISKLYSLVEVFKKISKIYGKLSELANLLETLEKKLDSLVKLVAQASPAFAKELQTLLEYVKTGVPGAFQVSRSDWQRFKFKDLSPDWDIRQQSGFAKVRRTIFMGLENVRVEFGKPKNNNDWELPADVVIDKSWSIFKNGLLGNQSATFGNFVIASQQ